MRLAPAVAALLSVAWVGEAIVTARLLPLAVAALERLMLVAELIVRTASDEAIASLRARLPFIREMAVSNNIDGVFWASVAFRNLEADICGNRQVKRILDSLGLRTLQLRHLSMILGPSERRVSDRERLVAAYEERNVPLAVELTRSMVLRSLAIIEQSGWSGFQTTKDNDHVA